MKEEKKSKKKEVLYAKNNIGMVKNKGKVIPLQVRCGPEGGYRYSSTLP